jgi:hypothetical protein
MTNPFAQLPADPGDALIKPPEGPAAIAPLKPNAFSVRQAGDTALAAQDNQNAQTPAYIADQTRRAEEAAARDQERLGLVQQQTADFEANLARNATLSEENTAKQLEVVARAKKVADMNPILRPFIQMFKPSLSNEEIATDAQVLNMESGVLQQDAIATARNYGQLLESQKTLWGAQDAAAGTADKLSDTVFNGIATTTAMAIDSFRTGAAVLSGIAEADKSEFQMAQVALAGLSDAQITAKHQAARAKGGADIEIDGVKIPIGMLEKEKQANDSADLDRESKQLAVQGGRINLARALEAREISTRPMSWLMRQVSAGGGGYPIDTLQREIANRSASGAAATAVIDSKTAGVSRVASAISQIGYQASDVVRRYGFTNGTGNLTNITTRARVTEFTRIQARQVEELARHRKDGTLTPQREEALLKETAQSYKMLIATISDDIDGQGGSPSLRIGKKAFLMNGTLDPGTAQNIFTESILAGRNANQAGMRGAAATAYNAGVEAFRGILAAKMSMSAESAKGRTKAQLIADFQAAEAAGKLKKSDIERVIGKAVAGSYSMDAAQAVTPNIPALLARSGVKINVEPAAWSESLAAGEAIVSGSLMKRYSLTKEQADDVLMNGEKSPYYSSTMASNKITGAFLAGRVAAATTQYLDHNFSDGVTAPSAEIARGLRSPEFANLAGQLQPHLANKDFGSFTINSLVGDNIASHIDGMQGVFLTAINERQRAIRGDGPKGVALYQGDPQRRFETVIHAIPSLQDADVKALLDAVRPQLPRSVSPGLGQMSGLGLGAKPDYSKAFDLLGSTKFDNPRLETLRKQVVKELPKAIVATDRAMSIRGSIDPSVSGIE